MPVCVARHDRTKEAIIMKKLLAILLTLSLLLCAMPTMAEMG